MSTNKLKTMSSFPSCFHPPSSTSGTSSTAITTTSPNLTTSLYQTPIGLVSLSWSRSLFSRSLHLILPNSSSFHLSLKPFLFWSHSGSRKLNDDNSLVLFWDFSRANFRPNSSPDPTSSFYLALYSASDNSTLLFLGDLLSNYRSRLASSLTCSNIIDNNAAKLVVRREHVCGAQFYATKTTLGGKSRDILIEVNKPDNDDPRLVIRFDNTRVIQVKHLKWKFRGSERFDVDGHRVHLSWDVYNWLFDDSGSSDENYALFTFRFEAENAADDERVVMWGHDSCGLSYERKKMRKKLVAKTSSSSSSSLSSTSSSGSSSVMEWESVEENELKAPTGFSLLVYAWKN